MYLQFQDNDIDSSSEIALARICWGCETKCYLACTGCAGCQGCSGTCSGNANKY